MRNQLCLFGIVLILLLSTTLTLGEGEAEPEEGSSEVAGVVDDAVAVVDAVIGDDSPNKGGNLAKSWDEVRPYVVKYGVPAIIEAEAAGADVTRRDKTISKRGFLWSRKTKVVCNGGK